MHRNGTPVNPRAPSDLRFPLWRVCVCAGRGGRLVLERLYLSLAGRSIDPSAASLVLPELQATDLLVSKFTVDQLAGAWRPVRKLRGKNCVSLFRRGTGYRSAVRCDLATLPVAGGDRVLDFHLLSDHRDLHRFRAFHYSRSGDNFVVGTEESLWSEYFARERDRLLLQCDEVRIDHHEYGNVALAFRYDRVNADGHVLMLDDVTHISGVARELVIPREAMGRGDLKFLAAIGAFLGWRAVLFSLFAGSLLGSIIGLITLVVRKPVWSAKLPFGPYLAFGAVAWTFFGELVLHWYGALLSP